MPFLKVRLLPTKLKYQLLISFCLMSVLPLLIGVYVASIFIRYPFTASPGNLIKVSLILVCSASLSLLGYWLTGQLVQPVLNVKKAADRIAHGDLNAQEPVHGVDEIEDLSRSLITISQNAKELLEKVEKLSLKDKLTGLYNASYIRERLNEEIQRAIHYQRPCSFAYLTFDRFESFVATKGQIVSEEVLKAAAAAIRGHLFEFDRAARLNNGEFAMIFPEKNKKRTIEILDKIRQEVTRLLAGKGIPADWVVFSVGISENPIDGVSADELYAKAQVRARLARNQGVNATEAFA